MLISSSDTIFLVENLEQPAQSQPYTQRPDSPTLSECSSLSWDTFDHKSSVDNSCSSAGADGDNSNTPASAAHHARAAPPRYSQDFWSQKYRHPDFIDEPPPPPTPSVTLDTTEYYAQKFGVPPSEVPRTYYIISWLSMCFCQLCIGAVALHFSYRTKQYLKNGG